MNASSISKRKKSVFCSYLNGRYNSSFSISNSMLNKNRNHGIISYSNGVPYVNMVWVCGMELPTLGHVLSSVSTQAGIVDSVIMVIYLLF
jgi:hypothetical protein